MEKRKALTRQFPSKVKEFQQFDCDPKQYHHIVRLYDVLDCNITNNKQFSYLSYEDDKRQYMIDIKRELCGKTVKQLEQDADLKISNGKHLIGYDYLYEYVNIDDDINNYIESEIKKDLIKVEVKPFNKSGKIFFIADTHFHHTNILEYDNLPFDDLEHYHKTLIDNWNNAVNNNDEIYILGDFSFGNHKQTTEILSQLNGIKYLIKGNHDFFLDHKNFDKSKFEFIKELHELRYDGKTYILCHYPVVANDIKRKNKIMLHGHIHNKILLNLENTFNVGVTLHNFAPISIEKINEMYEL